MALTLIVAENCQARMLIEKIYREWTLENGKSVMAKLDKVRDGKISLESRSKKKYTVPVSKLSYYDQLAVNKFLRDEKKAELPLKNKDGFDSSLRLMIPTINQSIFGRKKGSCVPNAFAHYVLWWNELGIFQIPKKGDRIKQAEWIHKELEQCFKTKSQGTSLKDAEAGVIKFFMENPSENYEMDVDLSFRGSLADLRNHLKGPNAVILVVNTLHKGKYDEGHGVCVVSLTDDNWITFNTWGEQFTGRLVKSILRGSKYPSYYIDLVENPGNKYYQWIVDGGGFSLSPDKAMTYITVEPKLKEKETRSR